MKIETKFDIGDQVKIRGYEGCVTRISVWVVEGRTEIEYSTNPIGAGLWYVEEDLEVVK